MKNKVRKAQIFICVLISILMMSVIPISATELEIENTIATEHTNSDFSNLQTFIQKENFIFNDKSLNDCLISYDSDVFGKMKWDLPNASENIAILNVEFDALSNNMDSIGFVAKYSLNPPKTELGYSDDVISMFSSTFGNTNNTLKEMKMPEGWSVSSIMNEAQNNRNKVLGDFKNSSSYQSIANSINTSSIFSEASKTMAMPECLSTQSCAATLSDIKSPFSLDKEYYKNQGNKYNSDADVMSMYSEYCDKAEKWIKYNKGEGIDDILNNLDEYYDGDINDLLDIDEEITPQTDPLSPIEPETPFDEDYVQYQTDHVETIAGGHVYAGLEDVDKDGDIDEGDYQLQTEIDGYEKNGKMDDIGDYFD